MKRTLTTFALLLPCCFILSQVNTISDTGNVGIGTISPSSRLEVVGPVKLKSCVVVDSAAVFKDSLKVLGDSRLQDVKIDGNALISGDAKIAGALSVSSQVNFGAGGYAMKYTSGTPLVMDYAPESLVGAVPGAFCSGSFSVPAVNRFAGMLQAWAPSVTGSNSNDILSMGYDGTNGRIELETGIAYPINSGPALRINYFCGRDVAICTGPNGGVTSMGANFEVGAPVRDINIAANISAQNKTGIEISNTFTTDGQYAQKNRVDRDYTRAFAVLKNASGTDEETFYVNGDGTTKIQVANGSLSPTSFLIANNTSGGLDKVFFVQRDGSTTIQMSAGSNVNAFDILDKTTGKTNFRIKRSGTVYMREGYVQVTNFPDYVFKPGYQLKSIEEVKQYVEKNGHLPGVPAAETVETDGMNVGEMQKAGIEKIEEIFLYLFEIKKELKEIRVENGELRKKVEELDGKVSAGN